MKSYRELIVWQKSMQLVTVVYHKSSDFPSLEIYGLTNQIRRSVVSIPSNKAEGFGRNRSKESVRFLKISRGSLYELQTQLEIAFNLQFLTKNDFDELSSKSLEIEKMLNSLISKIKQSNNQRLVPPALQLLALKLS